MHEEPGTLISDKELAWMLSPGTGLVLVLKANDGSIVRNPRIVTESSDERIVMMAESPGESIITFQGNPDMRIYLTDDGFVLRSGDTESRYLIVRSSEVNL